MSHPPSSRKPRPAVDAGIHDRIRSERSRLALTPIALAAALDVGRRTVWRWERGRAAPSAPQLAAMAALGFDVLYVLTGSPGSGDGTQSQRLQRTAEYLVYVKATLGEASRLLALAASLTEKAITHANQAGQGDPNE